MRKFITLLTSIMFLTVGKSAAQNFNVAACSNLGSQTYGPMYSTTTANATNRTAFIIPASQLSTLAGQTISSVYFNRNTASGAMGGSPVFKIYLKSTTATDFGASAITWATEIAGATLVYSGNPISVVGTTAGWKQFTLTSNFAYAGGTNNLAVFCEYTNTAANTTSISWYYEYNSPCVNTGNSNTTKYANNTTGSLPATTTSSDYRRPLIAFDYLNGCGSQITGLTTTAITTNSATISWNAGYPLPTTGYQYYYSTSSTAPTSATVPSGSVGTGTTSAIINSLTPATVYYYWVRSDCGTAQGLWSAVSTFTTACNPLGLPWSENFDGMATIGTGIAPVCWRIENGDWGTRNASYTTYNDPKSTPNYLTDAYTATNEFIWTPTFQLTAGVSYDFSFWFTGDGYSGWTGDVFYNSFQSSTGATQMGSSFVLPGTTTVSTYGNVLRRFVAPTTGTYTFGIRINATSVPYYLGFDDFSLTLSPPCTTPAPGNTLSTANGLCLGVPVTLSLQNATPGAGVTYQWQFSPDGVTYSNISGETNATFSTTPTVPGYYQAVVTCATEPSSTTSNPVQITFANSQPTVTGAWRCGPGTVTLGASTSQSGAVLNWYAAPIGGNSLATGGSYTTPSLSTTTTYYVGGEVFPPGVGTVGTGAVMSSSSGISPFSQYYEGQHTQYLVTAANLQATGLVSGNLTSLTFTITAKNSTKVYTGYTIKIGSTSATSLSGGQVNPAWTTVYGPSTYTSVLGANTFTFTTPFAWDGSSNIVVDVCFQNDPTNSGTLYSSNDQVSGTTMSGIVTNGYYQDNSAICGTTLGTNVTSTFLPLMGFGGTKNCGGPRTPVVATINPLPSVSGVVTEPTTCVTNDGAIDITVGAATGPFTYSWTTSNGSGLVANAEDQSTLIVGTYDVQVTDNVTGCQGTGSFSLIGPGGCSICPTIGTVSANPSPVCVNDGFSLTADGLANMGVTYGIQFVYSSTALADPYSGGTSIITVSNGSLSGGGTQAVAVVPSGIPAGSYYVYAILSPAPVDPSCRPSVSTMLTVTAMPSATVSYAGSPFCSNAAPGNPTITGTSGGTFSSTAGLTIDPTTGAVTPATSTPGTYTITYTVAAAGGCAVYTTTTDITITAMPSATISYAGTPYCSTVTSASPVLTGTTGGTFSSTAGLNINASTGVINPSASTAGTYTVTYTVAAAGGCAVYTTTTSVTVTAMPNATINYAGNPFCNNAAPASPTITGTTGGTFSSTAGLTINASTGVITPSTSTPGTYTVTYTVAAAGGCAAFVTTRAVTITAVPNATISYAGTPFCTSATSGAPTLTGTGGGTYSSTAGLSINAATGVVNPSASTPGTYTVTYTVAASGGCAVFTTTTSVTITPKPNATISYTAPLCQSSTSVSPVVGGTVGTTGGTYSSTSGLSINASTGVINPSASTAGSYTVTYTVAASGGCAVYTTTTVVDINTLSVAPTGINASSTTVCGTGNRIDLSVVGGNLGSGAKWVWYTGSCGGTYAGTGATLSSVLVNNNTTYYVRAEGACNTTACATVTLTLNTVPAVSIYASPINMTNGFGSITINADPQPAGNYTYQWYRNGVALSGQNGQTITVNANDPGNYKVVVSNGICNVSSLEIPVIATASNILYVSPNPGNGAFNVRYYNSASSAARKLIVYDSKADRVYWKDYNVSGPYTDMRVNIAQHSSGIYYIVLLDASGKQVAAAKYVKH